MVNKSSPKTGKKNIRFRRKLVISSEADLVTAEEILDVLVARAFAADNPQLFNLPEDQQKENTDR